MTVEPDPPVTAEQRTKLQILRARGAVAISTYICLIFVCCLVLAVWTRDSAMQQLLIGVAAGQFAIMCGFWLGSSVSSAQKDEQLSKQADQQAASKPP